MTVTWLEEELRGLFAERAEAPPPLPDPAGTAIARARRVRRRRTALAGALSLVMVLVAGVGALLAWPRPAAAPVAADNVYAGSLDSAPGGMAAIGIDLRVGNALLTRDGRRLALPGAGQVTWAYRVPTGWVYGGTAGTVRMLTLDGTAVNTLARANAAVVSPDGSKLAWSSGADGRYTLAVARLDAGRPRRMAVTVSGAAAVPISFAGPGVVFGRADGAGRPVGYAYWDLATPFRPTWNDQITAVYGGSGDHAVGLVGTAPGGGKNCLAYFTLASNLTTFKVERDRCGLGSPGGRSLGSLSPDRRWLADQTGSGVTFVWAVAGSAKPRTVGICPVRGRAAPVWEGDADVLIPTDRGVVRCRLDGSTSSVSLPQLAGQDWGLVPVVGDRPTAVGSSSG